jgi:hypothetical protein
MGAADVQVQRRLQAGSVNQFIAMHPGNAT